MQVGDNVRVLAAAKGTSPGGIAVEIGRSRQWIQNKLAGRNGWSVADVEAIAGALGVEPQVLMTTDWWPVELLRAVETGKDPADDVYQVPSSSVRQQGLEPRTRWVNACISTHCTNVHPK